MKRLSFICNSIVCAFLFVFLSISAAEKPVSNLTKKNGMICNFKPLIEAKVGYFFFLDSNMREIYDQGGLDVQLCSNYSFWQMNNKWSLNAYSAIEYLYRSGKSTNENQKTSLWMIPVNLGLRPTYTINSYFRSYMAIGPRYFYIHQHNDSSYVYKEKSKSGVGFFVNGGMNFIIYKHLLIDVFGEYSYAKIHFKSQNSRVYTKNTQVGGFTFGSGFGYEF